MGNLGGKREGAGRKAGIPNKSTLKIKEILDNCVDFEKVVIALYELTQGIEIQKNTQDGVKIYSERPDSNAAKILLEYGFGKPKQEIELSQTKIRVVKKESSS